MFDYFVPQLVPRRWIVGLWAVISTAAVWGLVCLYGEAGGGESVGVAALYVTLLLGGAVIYGFALTFIVSPVGRAAFMLFILVLGLGITWGISALLEWYAPEKFPRLIPLLVLCDVVSWAGLAFLLRRPHAGERETAERPDETPPVLPERRETIDRVSVKKGQDIHIVRIDELQYVQAEGDYVLLYTAAGRFLKEQTMRWFEEHLPDHFVRIHRSSIVNIDEIARVELFGKENYHVRLKNGTVLKASINGYRMLKVRLDL